MPKQSYLTKERKKLQKKAGKALRKRYETARDKAQERTCNAVGAAGRGTWQTVRHPITTAKNVERKANRAYTHLPKSRVGKAYFAAGNASENLIKAPFRAAGRVVKVGGYTKSDGTKVKGHNRQLVGLLVGILFSLLATTAQAHTHGCILSGGTADNIITIGVSSLMQPEEYHLLKEAMGHHSATDAEFLAALQSYCPEIESIELTGSALDTQDILQIEQNESHRQAWQEAIAEYAVYADRPQSGVGIIAYDNGYRLDTAGNWRSGSGNYAPTNVNHDPFEYSGVEGLAPTWESLPTVLDDTKRIVTQRPSTQPEPLAVIDAAGPEEEPTNEFTEEPVTDATGITGWLRWLASFCGTIVLVVILLAIVLVGVWVVGTMQKGSDDGTGDPGRYGLGRVGTYTQQVKSMFESGPDAAKGKVS